jgi:hypothetical protein
MALEIQEKRKYGIWFMRIYFAASPDLRDKNILVLSKKILFSYYHIILKSYDKIYKDIIHEKQTN